MRFHTVSEETMGVETSTLQTEPDTNPLIYLDGVIWNCLLKTFARVEFPRTSWTSVLSTH